jgi:hypothetical protein
MDCCVENWGGDGELETSKNKLSVLPKALALCNSFLFLVWSAKHWRYLYILLEASIQERGLVRS